MSRYRFDDSLAEGGETLDIGEVAVYISFTHTCAPWLPAIEPPLWTLFTSAAEPTPTTLLAVSFEEHQAATVDPILVSPPQDPRDDSSHKVVEASQISTTVVLIDRDPRPNRGCPAVRSPCGVI